MLTNKQIAQVALGCSVLPEISSFVILNGASARLSLRIWTACVGVLYLHVDDFNFGHENEDVANRAAAVVCSAWDVRGAA